MGQRLGLDSTIESLREVFEFHRRYRAFLQDNVQGYVFDNIGRNLYVLLSQPCDADVLMDHLKDYDGNVGVLYARRETAEKLGQYFSFDELDKVA